jgi:hypothetical protein
MNTAISGTDVLDAFSAIGDVRPETEAEIRALIRFDETGNSLDHLEYETLSRRRRHRTWARFAIAAILFAVAVAMPLLLL